MDSERRFFTIERMTYRGEGGWHAVTWDGSPLRELADEYLPHLGKEGFFDLI